MHYVPRLFAQFKSETRSIYIALMGSCPVLFLIGTAPLKILDITNLSPFISMGLFRVELTVITHVFLLENKTFPLSRQHVSCDDDYRIVEWEGKLRVI